MTKPEVHDYTKNQNKMSTRLGVSFNNNNNNNNNNNLFSFVKSAARRPITETAQLKDTNNNRQ